MEAKIDPEFKAQTEVSSSNYGLRQRKKKPTVRVESNKNTGSFVLRLRKYGPQDSQKQSFENSYKENNAPESGLSSAQTDIEGSSSIDQSMSIGKFTIRLPAFPKKEDASENIAQPEGINGSLMSIEEDDHPKSKISIKKLSAEKKSAEKLSMEKQPAEKQSLKRPYSDKVAQDIAESIKAPEKKLSEQQPVSRKPLKRSLRQSLRRTYPDKVAKDIAESIKAPEIKSYSFRMFDTFEEELPEVQSVEKQPAEEPSLIQPYSDNVVEDITESIKILEEELPMEEQSVEEHPVKRRWSSGQPYSDNIVKERAKSFNIPKEKQSLKQPYADKVVKGIAETINILEKSLSGKKPVEKSVEKQLVEEQPMDRRWSLRPVLKRTYSDKLTKHRAKSIRTPKKKQSVDKLSMEKEPSKWPYSDKGAKDIAESIETPGSNEENPPETQILETAWQKKKKRNMIVEEIKMKIKELSTKDVKTYAQAYKQFGVSHPLVQHHMAFLKNFFVGRKLYRACVQDYYAESLELKKPVKITKGFYLLKIGHPFLTNEEVEDEEFFMLNFYDGFVSLRQHLSFLTPGMLVYFYQAVVYIKEIQQMVYVIIPEDKEDLMLFHTNPDELLKVVQNKIRQVNQGITRSRKYKKQKKEYRFGDTHVSFIKEKILAMHESELDFTALLNYTIESAVHTSDPHQELPGLGITNNIAYQEDISIFEIMENVFNQKHKMRRMKIHMDIGDFFFGLKAPKALALREMFKRNQDVNLNSLPNKVKQHLCSISPKCEIKESKFSVYGGGSLLEYRQKTERQFVNRLMPSQTVWYVCEATKKSYTKTKVEEESYSITLLDADGNEQEVITGEKASECVEKLVEMFEKGSGSRGIMMEYFEHLVELEFTEYRKEDNVTRLFRFMYTERILKDFTENLRTLNELLEMKKERAEKNKNGIGRDGVRRINRAVKGRLIDGDGIEVIDEKILVTAVK